MPLAEEMLRITPLDLAAILGSTRRVIWHTEVMLTLIMFVMKLSRSGIWR